MNNRKTNTLSIIGFVVSMFSIIFGTLFCIIALNQIKETKEKGKSLAIGGIVINVIKVFLTILIISLYMFVPATANDNIQYKCEHAMKCDYHSESLTYTCVYNEDGVEEYITCDTDLNNKKAYYFNNDGTQDDPYNDDTFDYDAEY